MKLEDFIDSQDGEQLEINDEEEVVEETTEETTEETEVETPETPETPEEQFLEYEGKRYTIEEIKELEQGSLRQSDYTKKTQELARQRKELEEANEFYRFIEQNPELIQQIANNPDVDPRFRAYAQSQDPVQQQLMQLQEKQADIELQMELDGLKKKYPDFDEEAVLTKAYETNIYDLELLHNAIVGQKGIDRESIKNEVKQEILEEIQKNKNITKTTVSTSDKASNVSPKVELTAQQKRVASGLGMSYEEYADGLVK